MEKRTYISRPSCFGHLIRCSVQLNTRGLNLVSVMINLLMDSNKLFGGSIGVAWLKFLLIQLSGIKPLKASVAEIPTYSIVKY